MFNILHFVFAIIHLLLGLLLIKYYLKGRALPLLFLIAIALGLSYDNFVIGLGSSIGISENLQTASLFRFIIHSFLTPCLLITTFYYLELAKVPWTTQSWTKPLNFLLVLILIGIGVFQNLVGIDLVPVCQNDTLRYAERVRQEHLCEAYDYPGDVLERKSAPPISSIAAIIILAVYAALLWRKTGWFWLCLAAVLMFISAAIPASIVGLWVSNAGEVLLIMAMMMTAKKLLDTQSQL